MRSLYSCLSMLYAYCIYVLLLAHILFIVHCEFNTAPTKMLQQLYDVKFILTE